jgi:hypothetical protein
MTKSMSSTECGLGSANGQGGEEEIYQAWHSKHCSIRFPLKLPGKKTCGSPCDTYGYLKERLCNNTRYRFVKKMFFSRYMRYVVISIILNIQYVRAKFNRNFENIQIYILTISELRELWKLNCLKTSNRRGSEKAIKWKTDLRHRYQY